MSLKLLILNYLEHKDFIHAGLIEKWGEEQGYKGSNVSRRLRELENEGKIERKTCTCVKPSHVVYKLKPTLNLMKWWEEEKYKTKDALLNRLF